MEIKNTTIGFIGTGVMGKSMANHLLNAGYPVHLYTRTKSKADSLIAEGAVWADSVRELAAKADVIITMVGYPNDVEAVYFGKDGILENAKENTNVVDMTTSKPSLAAEIFEKAAKKQIHALDAPVSGGDVGAKSGKLAIMIG